MLVESHAKKLSILESCIKRCVCDGVDDEDDLTGNREKVDLYIESKELLDKEIESREVDLTAIIESRLYLEKCIQEVEYLLQSLKSE